MPKELVFAAGPPNPNVPPFMVKLTWGEGDDVQLSVVTREEGPLLDQLFYQSHVELGKIVATVAGAPLIEDRHFAQLGADFLKELKKESGFMDGLYVGLGRAQCNRLIQVLRRARNQVFGADE